MSLARGPCGRHARIAGAGNPDRQALLVVAGLDQALAQASPWTRSTASQTFNDLRAPFLTNGRLNEGTDGAVLPRRSWPGRPANAPERLTFAVQHTVRVSAADWQQVELEVVPAGLDLSEGELADGLRVVCVPVLEDVGEMSFQATAEQSYIIEPKDTRALRSRLEQVVASLDGSGAHRAADLLRPLEIETEEVANVLRRHQNVLTLVDALPAQRAARHHRPGSIEAKG